MIAKDLAELLMATPDLTVNFADEWGAAAVLETELVKIVDGTAYNNSDIALKNDLLESWSIVSAEEYSTWDSPVGQSYSDYVRLSEVFIENYTKLLAKIEVAPFSLLLIKA